MLRAFVALPSLCALLASSSLIGCDSGSSYQGDEGSGAPTSAENYTPPPSTVLPTLFGTPQQSGMGMSSDRYQKADVKRNDLNYYFMANGWGPGFESQSVTWNGTSFSVDGMAGKQGPKFEPATYPTVFCGVYSDSRSGACGLPKAVDQIASLRTGWRWNANGNADQYNAAYDIWLSSSDSITGHSAFLMVWLRDPPGQQPAGSRRAINVSVPNAPGVWDVWVGNVGGKPCISYTRTEGRDSPEVELDAMDFLRDALARNIAVPGTTILSVAVGFEIWNGPITSLESSDFYVQVE
jgi:Glycosyl hydrolase family 12